MIKKLLFAIMLILPILLGFVSAHPAYYAHSHYNLYAYADHNNYARENYNSFIFTSNSYSSFIYESHRPTYNYNVIYERPYVIHHQLNCDSYYGSSFNCLDYPTGQYNNMDSYYQGSQRYSQHSRY